MAVLRCRVGTDRVLVHSSRLIPGGWVWALIRNTRVIRLGTEPDAASALGTALTTAQRAQR